MTAALLALLVTSSAGPGLDPDSASYLSAAESLVQGKGYRIAIASWYSSDSTAPLAHFPPGYPTALAIPTAMGVAPPMSARIVNAVAAAVTATAVCVLVASSAGSVVAALVTITVLLLTPALIEVHLSALSEPLFLALEVLTLVALVMRDRKPLLAGVFAACATMVRYAGVALGGAVVLWAFLQRDTLAGRIRRAVIAGLPTAALQGAWIIRSRMIAGPHGIREVGVYSGFGATLRAGVGTIVQWFVPMPYGESIPLRGAIAVALIVAVVLSVAAGVRRVTTRATSDGATPVAVVELPRRVVHAGALLAICYVVVICLSRLFADPGIPFDNRILAPLELLLTVIAAVALTALSHGRVARGAIIVLLLGWAGLAMYADYDTVSYAMNEGSDFASSAWRESPTLAWARANAVGVPLYSNWAAAVYFHLHRPAHEIPASEEDASMTAFRDTLRARHAVVLAFDAPSPGLVDPVEVEKSVGLKEIAKLSDGRVLGAGADSTPPNALPR